MSLKTKQKIKDHTSVCSCVRITKRFDRNQSGALLDENPRFIASRKSSFPAFLTTTTTVLYKVYIRCLLVTFAESDPANVLFLLNTLACFFVHLIFILSFF